MKVVVGLPLAREPTDDNEVVANDYRGVGVAWLRREAGDLGGVPPPVAPARCVLGRPTLGRTHTQGRATLLGRRLGGGWGKDEVVVEALAAGRAAEEVHAALIEARRV